MWEMPAVGEAPRLEPDNFLGLLEVGSGADHVLHAPPHNIVSNAAMHSPRPRWVNGCPWTNVGSTSGVPKIAADLIAPPNSAALGQEPTLGFKLLSNLRARRHNGQVAANDFASSRAPSMKSWATGLIVRFFNVTMPTLP
jgi:hypothetical protein